MILSSLGEDADKPKMDVSSLTLSKYWDIGENYLNSTHLRHNSRLSQKQNEFVHVFTMVQPTNNNHVQEVMNNLKCIILDYLAAKKSGILNWHRDFCD